MRPIAHVVPAALIELLRHAPTSPGKVGFAWRAAVGPAVQRVSVARLEHRVLVVETSGPQWTREIERSSSVILSRVRSLLGADAVSRMEVRTNPNLKTPPA